MARFVRSLVLSGLILAGCQSTPADKLAFEALDSSWSTIGPEYTAYVQADATLDPVLKDQKVKLVADITRMLKEAVK